MPNVYTRTGDKGDTALFGGTRVRKQSLQVEAYGTVDEANAAIGAAKALMPRDELREKVHAIQHRLFVAAAELASDDKGREILDNKIGEDDITGLERLIDWCLEITGPQREFVVPGRDPISGAFHVARTVIRRAERRMLTLSESQPLRPELIKYVNRLSDTLYAIARVMETRGERTRIESLVREAIGKALSAESGRTSQGGGAVFQRYDLATAKVMAEAAEAKAREIGVPVVFAAVDEGGNLMLVHRMGDSLLGSIDIAINKAFTSAAFKLPTHALKELAAEAGPLFGIQGSNSGRLIVFGGGEPIFVDGSIAGGAGVSGGTVEEDVIILDHALKAAMGE